MVFSEMFKNVYAMYMSYHIELNLGVKSVITIRSTSETNVLQCETHKTLCGRSDVSDTGKFCLTSASCYSRHSSEFTYVLLRVQVVVEVISGTLAHAYKRVYASDLLLLCGPQRIRRVYSLDPSRKPQISALITSDPMLAALTSDRKVSGGRIDSELYNMSAQDSSSPTRRHQEGQMAPGPLRTDMTRTGSECLE